MKNTFDLILEFDEKNSKPAIKVFIPSNFLDSTNKVSLNSTPFDLENTNSKLDIAI
jgi:hypothetical protein